MASRRSPGEGTVTWSERDQAATARLTIGYNPAGNPQRISRNFSVRTHGSQERALIAARAWLGEQVAQRNRGTLIDPSRETLGSWIKGYLEAAAARLSAKTVHDYSYHLEGIVIPALGRVRLRDLTPRIIQTWTAKELRSRPAHTVWRAHKYLSQALNEAERLELIARNPANKVSVAKPPRAPLSRWSPTEIQQVLAWCSKEDPFLGAYIHLALVTGARRGELLGLKWANVHLEEAHPRVDIVEALSYVDSKPQFGPTKTGQTRRVYLDAATVRLLGEHRIRVGQIESYAKARWVEHDLVFPALRGGPQSEPGFGQRFRKMCTAAQVTRIRLYDLRSTYASLTEGKISETAAAARAGHSVEIRRVHYLRSVDEQQLAAALSLEELLHG